MHIITPKSLGHLQKSNLARYIFTLTNSPGQPFAVDKERIHDYIYKRKRKNTRIND
jgi:hypothetical protein